jgi:hypothetical protein
LPANAGKSLKIRPIGRKAIFKKNKKIFKTPNFKNIFQSRLNGDFLLSQKIAKTASPLSRAC